MIVSFSIGRKKSLAALRESAKFDGYLFLVSQVDAKIENPTEEDLYTMGCVAKVKQTIKLPGDVTHLIVEGVERAVLLEYQRSPITDYSFVKTVPQDRESYDKVEIEAVMRAAAEVFDEYTKVDTKGYTAETENDLKILLLKKYDENIDKDIKLGFTTVGPHRDDIKIVSNGIDLRSFGSQGQQRTASLSLKLAELEVFKENLGEYPVLLLDDVLSELDSTRQTKLLEFISPIQTLLTCTDFDFNINHKKLYIENGKLVDKNQ